MATDSPIEVAEYLRDFATVAETIEDTERIILQAAANILLRSVEKALAEFEQGMDV